MKLVVLLGLLLSPASQARAAELRWAAPPDCAERDHTLHEIERLLDAPLAEVEGLHFSVILQQTAPDRLHVKIVTQRAGAADRTRELSTVTCAEAADAAAVAIAMAVTSNEASVGSATTQRARGPAADLPAGAPARPEPKVAAAPAAPWVGSFGVSGALDHGALPELSAGVEGRLSVAHGILKLTALGAYFAPRSAQLSDGRGGEISLVLGGALACAERTAGRILWRACAGAELGSLRAQGVGLNNPRLGSSLWKALRAQASIGWEVVPRVFLVAELALILPLARPTFQVDGADPIHRVGTVAERGLLGVEFLF